MSYNIPTTQETIDQFLANFEAELNQTSPLNDKAFLRVASVTEGMVFTSIFKYAAYKVKQTLAITASRAGLITIGNDLNLPIKPAEATVLEATLPGTDTTVIPQTIDFIGDANGVRYFLDSSATIGTPTPGVAELSMTAEDAGVVGNLQVGDTLSIGTQVAGAETVATVTAITNTGAEEEGTEAYRVRVLDRLRAVFGGGNAADYREWAQEVAGVTRAYPYRGKPVLLLAESFPPERTVYIEADTTIDPDGIAPQSLLDEVRASITTNPTTGKARQPAGLTDETLFVETIARTIFFVQITNLTVNQDIEATVKSEIASALTAYFLNIKPFVTGLDAEFDRNDKITDLSISNVVQDVLSANGASGQAVQFGVIVGFFLDEYQLNAGELAKLGGVNYV